MRIIICEFNQKTHEKWKNEANKNHQNIWKGKRVFSVITDGKRVFSVITDGRRVFSVITDGRREGWHIKT